MVEEIPPEDVKEKLDEGEDVQVVDIRSEDAFENGHIPGAINVPMHRLPASVDEHDWGDDVVVACKIGQSSLQAAKLIGSYEGVDDPEAVKSMDGGYEDWDYELNSISAAGSEE